MMFLDATISVWDGHMSAMFLHSLVFSHVGCRLLFNKLYIANFELVNHGQYIISLSSKPNLKAWDSWQTRKSGTLFVSHFKTEKAYFSLQAVLPFCVCVCVLCFVYLNITLGTFWFWCWRKCFRICQEHLVQHCSCVTETEGTVVIMANVPLQILPASNMECWHLEWLHIESMWRKLPSFGQSLILLALMVKSI